MKETQLEKSLYHSLLRIAAVTIAFVLLFDSGVLFKNSSKLSDLTQEYLVSSVGFSMELDSPRSEISNEQVANVASAESNSGSSNLTLSFMLFVLLSLMLLNYVFDYLRFGRVKQRYNLTEF